MKSKYLNFYILSIIILLVFISSFFVNVGTYSYDDNNRPIEGTYSHIETDNLTAKDLLTSPINGIIGIDNKKEHNIDYKNSGVMAGSIALMILVLSIGAYMQVVDRTNALSNYISNNINIIGGNIYKGIFLVMLFFTLGATTHGMYETTIGFAPLIILMYDKLRINRIEVLFLMLLPLSVGHIGGTINPFATGIASSLLGISILDGIGVRIILLVVLFIISYIIVIKRIRKYDLEPVTDVEALDVNKRVIWLFLVPFIIMIYAFIPGSVLKLDFITVAIVFIIFAMIIGLVDKLKFEDILDQIFLGINKFFMVAFAIGFARGIYVLLYNSYLSDTLINQTMLLLDGRNIFIVIIILMAMYLVMGFLIPSTSALAMITIPIIGAAITMMGLAPELVVTIYQSMIGVLKIVAPTSPLVIALLTMTGIEYTTWLRACYKYVLLYIVIIYIILGIFYGG